ncbi:membrane-targeted effector domain-containing toxin [Pseudomonas sp. KU26590]|uniref:membrane-targeted effector domain-containing toxin n=1 Tax=Pseudomonas sp. KU26590 TaxID=2991051 RepID=UPI00223DC012|nr:membrane-targeted effector domain-containing toxin [Pseudomonas sp. KU26590]UZJ60101.1 membrane-targeted effector domain-containing toxin [Pseudomonas sp. KU26590]
METFSLNPPALDRLTTLAAVLDAECQQLDPKNLTDASPGLPPLEQATPLHSAIERFWAQASARDISRRELFVTCLELTLRDDLLLNIEEGELHRDYSRCLPGMEAREHVVFRALELQLDTTRRIEFAGAIVATAQPGQTLLWLPGQGVEGFVSNEALQQALARRINHPLLRLPLLRLMHNSTRQAWLETASDGDVFLEPHLPSEFELTPIKGSPYDHAFDRLLDKQRVDIDALFETAHSLSPQDLRARLEDLLHQPKGWGPDGAIAAAEDRRAHREQRRARPDWLEMASTEQRERYASGLMNYERARSALMSVMDGAASPQQFARSRLRARLANDPGIDLDPDEVLISTQRTQPITGETFTVSRTLTHLALYGLHPGDTAPGSPFQTHSRITYNGLPLEPEYSDLTPAYLADVINEQDLRSRFGPAQRQALGSPTTQRLMSEAMHHQLIAQARGAELQGHIQPSDLALIESLNPDSVAPRNPAVSVQQIKLNEHDTLSSVLLLRKVDASGQSDGLLMFTPDSPRARHFQRFDNERQLLGELVSWSRSHDMNPFLLEQVTADRRDALKDQLHDLSEKPAPAQGWISYATLPDYNSGLRTLVSARVEVMLSEQRLHTPDWFLRASAEQRQKMVALEDAIMAAGEIYQATPHTQVTDFNTYVHRTASRKINALLGLPPETVDPDRIIIQTPRETLSYTQMLRDGYDDTLGLLNASADTTATFSGPQGVDLTPLSPEKVAGSVRGQWLADQYIEMIRGQLLAPASEGYDWRRQQSLLLTQLQMRADALRSFLEGHIDASQLSWLTISILNMHHSSPAERLRYPVYPLQLNVDVMVIASRAEIIHGCFLLAPPDASSLEQVLLYTPQAPDGRLFRPLTTFSNTLLGAGMGDYYLSRARLKAGMPLAFALAELKKGGGRKPALPNQPFSNLYDVCFNQVIERKIQDVADTRTGRADMLCRQVWSSLELIATAVTLPFPPASFAVGMIIASADGYRALQALDERDHATASFYVLSAWLNTAGAAGDLHSGIKGLGGVMRDLTGQKAAGRYARSVTHATDETLQPVAVENELFWAAPQPANRHVPLYRTRALIPETLQPTGRYAQTDVTGIWRALQQDTAPVRVGDTPAQPLHAVGVSLTDALPLTRPHGQGVSVVRGNFYIAMQGQTYQVQYDVRLAAWQIVDPRNPFAFFGRQTVRLNSQGQWQLLETARLRGGVLPPFSRLDETPAGPATAVGDVSDYEMPESLQPYVFGIVSPRQAEHFEGGPFGLHEFFDDIFQGGRSTYQTLRQNLYRDAKAFFEQPPLPSKPDLPLLEDGVTPQAFFEAALEKSSGLVIGEAPTSIASKQLLIDNMPLLAEHKVEVLYIEHLQTDQHTHKLQKYRALGGKTRSGSHMIKHYLDTVNEGALKNGSDRYDYYHLIKAAHRHGIDVRPFSSSVSYDYAGNEVASAAGDVLAPQKMAVFFGNKVISGDLQTHPGRRWIALLDHRTANTWQQQPGISELQGVLSLRVEDVPSGTPIQISVDSDAVISSAASRADFKAQIGNPNIDNVAGASSPVSPSDTSLDDALYGLLERRSPMAWGLDPNRRAIVSHRRSEVNPYTGDHGFEWNPAGYWTRADGAIWSNDYPLGAIQQSLIDNRYQMPAEMQSTFHDLAHFRHRGLNPDYFFVESHLVEVRERFFGLASTLQKDARSVLTLALPERVMLPEVKTDTPLSMFIEELYENTSGVVIGESHSALASKRFILDNMEHLVRQDVKTLYMEHLLTDLHQADLDRFAETGLMSKRLLHDLKRMDKTFRTDPTGVYSFERLVVQAKRHGIEIRAIDCAAGYFIRHLPTHSNTTRQQVFSYFASRTIHKHQQVMGPHKWMALVGETHANTFKNSVPGIAELEQGIGVRVMDVAQGKGRGIMMDPGEQVPAGVGHEAALVKNDFLVEIELPKHPQIAAPVSGRLHSPGMFLLDESDPLRPTIVHRSRDRTLKHTPVQFNTAGKAYIERESWPQVHRQPFDNVQALIDALVEMNLKHAN